MLSVVEKTQINHIRTNKFGTHEKQGISPGSRDMWALNLNSIKWLEQHVYELAEKSKSMLETKYDISIDISGGIDVGKDGLEHCICSSYKEGDRYTWHTDANKKTRTLTVVTQLSEEKDYENGDFQVKEIRPEFRDLAKDPFASFLPDRTEDISASRRLGNTLVFTPETLHRVAEVTKGVRKSLIFWFHNKHK